MNETEKLLKRMRTAIPTLEVLSLTCPYCSAEMSSRSGALNWTMDELAPGLLAVPCGCCDKEVKLPHGKTVRIP